MCFLKIFHYGAVQYLRADTVIVNSEMSESLFICKFLFCFTLLYSLPPSLPNISISSLLSSDISIALLLPRCLWGELEHMCVSRFVFVRRRVRAYVLWVRSLHVTLVGTKQVQAKWL